MKPLQGAWPDRVVPGVCFVLAFPPLNVLKNWGRRVIAYPKKIGKRGSIKYNRLHFKIKIHFRGLYYGQLYRPGDMGYKA
jgi:hypothetical protein